MPKNHARKKALADLKDGLGIKHTCAIALLDHPDADEQETLERYLAEYVDINTYREAVDCLRQEQADPRNQVLCETCGWTKRDGVPGVRQGLRVRVPVHGLAARGDAGRDRRGLRRRSRRLPGLRGQRRPVCVVRGGGMMN
ncbi:hypothetical protein ACFRSX_31040 [Streptomyces goshikiensis]|uniref:hypothetical protein n=1 Tax=Streptomyces TaxID=1883 RepID=UPI00131C5426|nr:hypothetical protein [Streptomyces sp. CB02120-2]